MTNERRCHEQINSYAICNLRATLIAREINVSEEKINFNKIIRYLMDVIMLRHFLLRLYVD